MLSSSLAAGSAALPSLRVSVSSRSRASAAYVVRTSAHHETKPSSIALNASSRRVLLVSTALSLAAWTKAALAETDTEAPPKDYSTYNSGAEGAGGQSDLVKRLLAKSAENKSVNDSARKAGIDKSYESYLAIAKGTGFVPEDQATRDKMGITRPPECDLPFFKTSPTCKKF